MGNPIKGFPNGPIGAAKRVVLVAAYAAKEELFWLSLARQKEFRALRGAAKGLCPLETNGF